MYPIIRMRRYRKDSNIRSLFKESEIRPEKLIMPVFVDETEKDKKEIPSMPDIYRYSLSAYENYIKYLEEIGVKSIILFGIPAHKDETGSSSYDSNGIIQKAIRTAKQNTDLNVIADLCLCEYTSTGHCGIIENGYVNNDKTLEIYQKEALSYADAGVDIIAPSGMMDGQVKAIREVLDKNGYTDKLIMAYSSKFASGFYGPFRDAAESAPQFGDRKSYQMDYHNGDEALREIELDIKEGADIVMVKPALAYLDIISRAKRLFNMPMATYSVSGEYTMIKNAVKSGYLGENIVDEVLTAFFRAGSDLVISYFAEDYIKSHGKH
ncbi:MULTISPECIES: porphobilinogen synthase [Acidiplasma]|jgi:porphobilinogen synthase|uniref:Delta-aminolevulinic acid dehydratase n=2 Tax=Acidiplasma TaxID=507753 RepID=A0A0N8VKF1_9ARCH|nr:MULTISPECIES: porphobilinogen synthase [Acidiplasma]KPV46189.1 delta-aminolevulinic acid dehydratase [Acidiplasma aeolicum]KQB33548.1 delta-aminolevulinic acid dehydratase [Acidiplasma cupricumulans]KQB34757.1 delta-aminolevulinic acid dehydratase [Acidiplasma aeolicum]